MTVDTDSYTLLDRGSRYRVSGYDGVAFWYAGDEIERYWTDYYDDIDERATGMVRMVMVGDDREWIIDPDDCTPLRGSEYCRECGQIGCGWHVVDDDDDGDDGD